MAPSNMFSYLRPGHNKRNVSSTSFVSPEISNAPASPLESPTPHLNPSPGTLDPNRASSSPVSPYPPQLPPIPRVASQVDHERGHSRKYIIAAKPPETMSGPLKSIPYDDRELDTIDVVSGENTGQRIQAQYSAHYLNPPPERPQTASSSFLSPSNIAPNHTASSSLLSPSNIAPHYTKHSKSATSLLGGLGDKFSGAAKLSSVPSVQPAKSGKSRLNLRNPMSLLMRRRSGLPIQNLSDESLVTRLSTSNIPPIPDNYDPSIRGRIVHDFSAPRPNRNLSYNNTLTGDQDRPESAAGAGPSGRYSPQKIEREHTPIFKENFDDNTSYEQSQAAIRAEKLANNEFLARNSLPSPPSLPPPAAPSRRPPPLPSEAPAPDSRLASEAPTRVSSTMLSPVQEAPSPTDDSAECTPKKRTSTTKSQMTSRSRGTSLSDSSFVPAGLPAHFTSRASRFSFQIGAGESTQEKMLEERHRRKAAEKAANQYHASLDEEYDEYDMDDYDIDADMEEDIPMVGDYDESEDMILNSDVSGAMEEEIPMAGEYEPSGTILPSSEVPASAVLPADLHATRPSMTVTDVSGILLASRATQGLGIAMAEQICRQDPSSFPNQDIDGFTHSSFIPEAGSVSENARPLPPSSPGTAADSNISQSITTTAVDDLYFDDGMIQEQGDLDATEFDEAIFDDPSGPLFARKVESLGLKDRLGALASKQEPENEEDDEEKKDEPSHTTAVVHPPNENMSAYHSALAEAAQRAEAEGRFVRKASVDVGESPEPQESSSLSDSRPSLVPDDGRISQETTGFPYDDALLGMNSSFADSYDYSDFDDMGLEDDPMIAEANAEALANDFEGFYGREFGFYASGQSDSFGAYGGYFGSSNLGRSMSGRNALQEPTLTPITERTESARNSVASLNPFWSDGQPPQSPGLAQLARLSPYGWPDGDPAMTFEGLKKLRKTTFGSTTSLSSSTGNSPRNSSPMGMQYVPRNASAMSNYPMHPSYSSDALAEASEKLHEDGLQSHGLPHSPETAEDLIRDDGILEAGSESPTLTNAAFGSTSQPGPMATVLGPLPESLPVRTFEQSFEALSIDTSPSSPAVASSSDVAARRSLGLVSPVSTSSPVTPGGSWRPTHSRKTSTADSVTYVREHDDDSGQDRWVLERRRTAESGELELVGREAVRGTI